MGKKTLGVIGKGKLAADFFKRLVNNPIRAESFFGEVGSVIFYNPSYDSYEHFMASRGFQALQPSLESLVRQYGVGVGVKDRCCRNELKDEENCGFVDFFVSSDVIVDLSKGYLFPSLLDYAKNLAENKSTGKKEISCPKDFQVYTHTSERGKILLPESEFRTKWQETLDIIKIVKELSDKGNTLGKRSFMEVPFNSRMLVERATLTQHVLERGIKQLPTYIMVTNEPCFASTLLTGLQPLLIPYTVALTGFDLQRLEEELNNKYQSFKKKAGLGETILRVALAGVHDTEVMVPVIYPQQEKDVEKLQCFFEQVSYRKVYDFLSRSLGEYYHRHDPELADAQVHKSILKTIINACRSRGKALSLYPELNERPLCNGYFQPLHNDGSGLFLVGNHRFRNGQVYAEEINTGSGEVREFIDGKIAGATHRMRELIGELLKEPKESEELRGPLAGSGIRIPQMPSPKEEIRPGLEKVCFVVVKVKEGNMKSEEIRKIPYQKGSWQESGIEPLPLPNHRYRALACLNIDGVYYLAAAHNDRQGGQKDVGIELYNLKGDEYKSIIIGTGRGINNDFTGIITTRLGQERLIARNEGIGLISIPIEEILRNEYLTIRHDDSKYLIPKDTLPKEISSLLCQETFSLKEQQKFSLGTETIKIEGKEIRLRLDSENLSKVTLESKCVYLTEVN